MTTQILRGISRAEVTEMIGFKQFLEESRSAPLYHATSMSNIISILKVNTLNSKYQDYGESTGSNVIFTTRSLEHAKHFAKVAYIGSSVIIVFNQQRISQKYRIKPIKNWHELRSNMMTSIYATDHERNAYKVHKPMYMNNFHGNNEFEEIIITNKISNVSSYIDYILVNDINDKNQLEKITTKLSIEVRLLK